MVPSAKADSSPKSYSRSEVGGQASAGRYFTGDTQGFVVVLLDLFKSSSYCRTAATVSPEQRPLKSGGSPFVVNSVKSLGCTEDMVREHEKYARAIA